MRNSTIANYVLYQAGWFACVLGGAWRWPWTGFGIGLILLLVQIAISRDRGRDARLIAVTVLVGLVVEVIQIAAGTYSFSSGTFVAALPPAWMLMLWAQFAATFAFSLKPIITRPLAAAAFGAVGGPVAFVAGHGLGAVTLLPPTGTGLLQLALSWGLALTLLSAVARRELPPPSTDR